MVDLQKQLQKKLEKKRKLWAEIAEEANVSVSLVSEVGRGVYASEIGSRKLSRMFSAVEKLEKRAA